MPRVYETMRRAELKATADEEKVRFVIRLWLDGHDARYADGAILSALNIAAVMPSSSQAAQAIADRIEHLNAVEVLDGEGNGSLVYPEWP